MLERRANRHGLEMIHIFTLTKMCHVFKLVETKDIDQDFSRFNTFTCRVHNYEAVI